MVTPADLPRLRLRKTQNTIEEKIEDSLGPNECKRLIFDNEETGERVFGPCGGKRCTECGPRRQMRVWLQMENMHSGVAHIGRFTSGSELTRGIERAKKKAQRSKTPFFYTVIEDMVISNVQILESQAFSKLIDWKDRLLEALMFGLARLRRSQSYGKVSRLTKKKREQVGTSWIYKSIGALFHRETPHEKALREAKEATESLIESLGVNPRDFVEDFEIHQFVTKGY